ncbi:type II toxin-antitoxin system VapB family antitoxin [Arthrobacter sp. A5]|uniref:type II toxin-antitoxin system VapB family antitoxin n=1 Tax=Arthrobacter sp. A5 TaxID=576926 RepID=UPI003DA7F3BE
MRTTLNLDDELLAQAREPTGINERSALLREALTALIARESSSRLSRLGAPIRKPPRRHAGGPGSRSEHSGRHQRLDRSSSHRQ